jgi:hypothetical protein
VGRALRTTFGLGLVLMLAACGEIPADGPGAGGGDEPVFVLARDDGWRDGLMEAVGHRYLVMEVATDERAAQQAWSDNVPEGLPERAGPPDEPGVYVPFDEVDLETHAVVVVSSGTSSSCPAWPADVRLRDTHVEVDLATDVDAGTPCTDDLAPYRVVLAIDRDRLPTPDALPIGDVDLPSENLTRVDGMMTAYPAG